MQEPLIRRDAFAWLWTTLYIQNSVPEGERKLANLAADYLYKQQWSVTAMRKVTSAVSFYQRKQAEGEPMAAIRARIELQRLIQDSS